MNLQWLQLLGWDSVICLPKTRFWSECENWGMPV